MSNPIAVDIPHRLGVAEAKRRLDQGFMGLAEQMGGPGFGRLTSAWDGDRMTFSLRILGQAITGQLVVAADLVRIEVYLPAFLAGLAGGVRDRLQKQGQALLEKK